MTAAKIPQKTNENTENFFNSKSSVSQHSAPQCQDMIRPETESEALACLISSNYLTGYYAGNWYEIIFYVQCIFFHTRHVFQVITTVLKNSRISVNLRNEKNYWWMVSRFSSRSFTILV